MAGFGAFSVTFPKPPKYKYTLDCGKLGGTLTAATGGREGCRNTSKRGALLLSGKGAWTRAGAKIARFHSLPTHAGAHFISHAVIKPVIAMVSDYVMWVAPVAMCGRPGCYIPLP